MIEKILSRLSQREEYLKVAMTEDGKNGYKNSAEKAMNELVAIKYAIQIVQEVAKEYEEKKLCRIALVCLEDTTSLEMELTEQEYLFLERITDAVNKIAVGCMPIMYVEQKGE